jgi:uncharacterized protein YndB with AHSA1/START domain
MSIAESIPPEARSLRLVRTFEAPRVLVFKCWTDPVHLAAWWAPRPFSMPRLTLDVRPGGRIEAEMQTPEGLRHPFDGEYVAVEEPSRLEFRTRIREGDGVLFENAHVVTFTEDGDRTTVTLEITIVSAKEGAAPYLAGMAEGWAMCLDQLAEVVALAA